MSRDRPQGQPVGAVIFDYGLTLVGFTRPAAALEHAQAAIAARIAAAGHPRPSVAEVTAVHQRVEDAVAAHEARGVAAELDVAVVERRAFADVGLELDDELLDECSRLIQEAWLDGVRVYPDVVPALHRLREMGLRRGLCSNAPYRPASMRAQLAHLGLDGLLDAVVFSGEVGWRKPSPILFTACLHSLGVSAAETVFVGDRVREDIGGAQACGMRTVLIDRPGAPGRTRDSRAAIPDAVIASLVDLPALLMAPTTVAGRPN